MEVINVLKWYEIMRGIKMKKIGLAIGILTLLFTVGCSAKELVNKRDYVYYSEITAEDYETMEYVDKNSDYVFSMMDEMDTNDPFCGQYLDVGNLYGEKTEDGNVDSQGTKIDSQGAIFRYSIFLRDPSDYHILGVHPEDTYKEAREAIENAGFTWESDSPLYGDRTDTIFKKGNVGIRVTTYNTKEEGMDNDIIDSICVYVPLRDESYKPIDGNY